VELENVEAIVAVKVVEDLRVESSNCRGCVCVL
jgi:hypothetical protein